MFKNRSKKSIAILCSVVVACIAVVVCLIVLFQRVGDGREYKVSFYSDDGTVLKVDAVQKHQSATPPVQPEMSFGTVFVKWDKDFSDITSNVRIHPVTKSVKGESNVFALSGTYGQKGSEVYVPLQLCGDVLVSGFEVTVQYDSQSLELLSVFNVDGGVVYNDTEPGVIRLNYVSIENTTADVDICTFKFMVKAENGDIPISTSVINAYANDGDDMRKADYGTIDAAVFAY